MESCPVVKKQNKVVAAKREYINPVFFQCKISKEIKKILLFKFIPKVWLHISVTYNLYDIKSHATTIVSTYHLYCDQWQKLPN